MFVWKAKNEIFFDDNVGGKGRYFKTRFLQPGLVKYSFGVCELDKKTIDRFINGFVGCPVIIDHNDVTDDNAKELSCGNICHVWFNEEDGWFWGDGIITSEEAVDLVKNQGYNVSCQYEITEYKENIKDDLHNGNPFDKIILNGRPEHLAIVKNPRYENAMIAVNAIEVDNGGPGSGRKPFGEALDDANKKYEEDKPVQKEEERDIQEELRQNRTQTHFQREELKGKNIIDAMNEIKEEIMNWFKRDDISDKDVKRALNELKEDGVLKAFFACNKKDDDVDWITVKGNHIPVKKGQSKEEAAKEFVEKQKSKEKTKKGNYDVGDRISFDANWRGVNPRISKGKIVSVEKSWGVHGDPNPDIKYQVKMDNGKVTYIDEDAIRDGDVEVSETKGNKKSKDKDSLKGKYAKEDVDFDPKQLKEDIKQAQKEGYKSAEDIADYLGLDVDEVSEELSPTDKKERKFDEKGFEKFKKEKQQGGKHKSSRQLVKDYESAVIKEAGDSSLENMCAQLEDLEEFQDEYRDALDGAFDKLQKQEGLSDQEMWDLEDKFYSKVERQIKKYNSGY